MTLQPYPGKEPIAGIGGVIREAWHKYFEAIDQLINVKNYFARGPYRPESSGITADSIELSYSLVNGAVNISIKVADAAGITVDPANYIVLPKTAINKTRLLIIDGDFMDIDDAHITGDKIKLPTIATTETELIINGTFLTVSENQEVR